MKHATRIDGQPAKLFEPTALLLQTPAGATVSAPMVTRLPDRRPVYLLCTEEGGDTVTSYWTIEPGSTPDWPRAVQLEPEGLERVAESCPDVVSVEIGGFGTVTGAIVEAGLFYQLPGGRPLYRWLCSCKQDARYWTLERPDGVWPVAVPAPDAMLRELVGYVQSARQEIRRAMEAERARLRRADRLEPQDHQERHSPTVPVEVVINRKVVPDGAGGIKHVEVTKQTGVRRVLEAKLWDGLEELQQWAAESVETAVRIISRGGATKRQAFERVDGSGGGDAMIIDPRVKTLWQWQEECGREGIDPGVTVAVICDGHSLHRIDKEKRVRKGWARGQLGLGLDLYARLQGWRPRRTAPERVERV